MDATVSAISWAQENFGTLDLGDKRLNDRAVLIAVGMHRQSAASIPAQAGDSHQAKAVYRFMDSSVITYEALTAPHRNNTLAASGKYSETLLIQDSTELTFGNKGRRKGLGSVGDGKFTEGLHQHTTLAVVPAHDETMAPKLLGVAALSIWARMPKDPKDPKETRTQRRRRPSRESLKWARHIEAIGKPPPGIRWTYVGDREADVWETFTSCIEQGADAVIRSGGSAARRNAMEPGQEQGEEHTELIEIVRAKVPMGKYVLHRRGREGVSARGMTLSVSWCEVNLLRPCRLQGAAAPMSLRAVRVWESRPGPKQEEPIEWVLLTTLEVKTFEQARQVISRYEHRWIVEEFHKCLKTGCAAEERQLETGARLTLMLAMLAVVATSLLQLKAAARNQPQTPAKELVSEDHVQVLAAMRKLSPHGMTCDTFFREVAKLGGFMGRKNDGQPGWLTIWRGMLRLEATVEGYRMACQDRRDCG